MRHYVLPEELRTELPGLHETECTLSDAEAIVFFVAHLDAQISSAIDGKRGVGWLSNPWSALSNVVQESYVSKKGKCAGRTFSFASEEFKSAMIDAIGASGQRYDRVTALKSRSDNAWNKAHLARFPPKSYHDARPASSVDDSDDW